MPKHKKREEWWLNNDNAGHQRTINCKIVVAANLVTITNISWKLEFDSLKGLGGINGQVIQLLLCIVNINPLDKWQVTLGLLVFCKRWLLLIGYYQDIWELG